VRSGRKCGGFPGHVLLPIPIPIARLSSSTGLKSNRDAWLGEQIIQRPRQIRLSTDIYILPPTAYRPESFSFSLQDGQYFQVFQRHVENDLSAFFDSEFWTRSVLQESHSQSPIRHLTIALGSLYKSRQGTSQPSTGFSSESIFNSASYHYKYALQQYRKAVMRLRGSLEHHGLMSHRTILMSIVLFTCVQYFIGDYKTAISQIQHGLRLIEERKVDSKQSFAHCEDDIEDELLWLFSQLAFQAKSFEMTFRIQSSYMICLATTSNSDFAPPEQDKILSAFGTAQERGSAQDAIHEPIMVAEDTLASYRWRETIILLSSVKGSETWLEIELSQWSAAFEVLLHNRQTLERLEISESVLSCLNILKMTHIMTNILFSARFSASEAEFDSFMPQFQEIVELAKEVEVYEELLLKSFAHNEPLQPCFLVDLGVVAPLFFVATKCRDRLLRREAIFLLLVKPRIEGMWDGILCGRVGEWIMEIEEEGLSEYGPGYLSTVADVPEERRVVVKEILINLQEREAKVRCGARRTRMGDLTDKRARQTRIVW
jgi:hypothetical protein